MLPIIGFMIGTYINVRFWSFIIPNSSSKENWFVRIMSLLGLLLNCFLMFALWNSQTHN